VKTNHNPRLLILTIILIGAFLPITLYWFIYGNTEMVTPLQAKVLLNQADSNALLIDIRSKEKYDSAHINQSRHWSNQAILAVKSKESVPEEFQNKTILLICDNGILSNFAVKHLKKIGIQNAINVRGGLQEWIGSVSEPQGGKYETFISSSGLVSEFPTKISPLSEKLIAVISAYVIKPTYTILSLVLAILLWRKNETDLVALRWSMIFFFLGENCCAINFLIFTNKSYLFEYLHSFGMLLSFSFVAYAVVAGIDCRILMLSSPDKKCAVLKLCKKCIKYENVPCGLKRVFLIIIPASIVIALMPLCSDWHLNSYNTVIFGTFYNYSHQIIHQQFEFLYCPIAAVMLLAVSFLILLFKKENPLHLSKLFFAAGIGPLGFGLFRAILAGIYNQNLVWFNFWEEFTELLFIIGVCFILWIFRQSLIKTTGDAK